MWRGSPDLPARRPLRRPARARRTRRGSRCCIIWEATAGFGVRGGWGSQRATTLPPSTRPRALHHAIHTRRTCRSHACRTFLAASRHLIHSPRVDRSQSPSIRPPVSLPASGGMGRLATGSPGPSARARAYAAPCRLTIAVGRSPS